MALDRHFWFAATLSGCVHAGAFSLIWAFTLGTPITPPMPLLPYGDATVEGLSVDAVSLNSGSLWQDEHDKPGAALVQGIPVKPRDLPKLSEPETPKEERKAEPALPPFASEEVAPISPAEVAEPQQPQPPPRPEAAPAETRPAPKPAQPQGTVPKSGTPEAAPANANTLPGVGRSPAAQGSSRLPEGTPSAGGRVGFATGVSMAGYQKPLYPNEAKLRGMQGTVLIWLSVSAEGRVTAAKVQQSSGYDLLDKTALDFAYTIQFRPARQGNSPVAAEATLPVVFSLLDSR